MACIWGLCLMPDDACVCQLVMPQGAMLWQQVITCRIDLIARPCDPHG